MGFSHFFVNRPIFATVLSTVIVIVGVLAALRLPIAQYPDVAPPTVVVSANYPGATPEVIGRTVGAPIEQQVNGVEGMIYMSSSSTTDGAYQLTITFGLGTDLETAQVLVQNRVSVAEPRLPEVVRRIGVTTNKQTADILLVGHLVSPDDTLDQLYISNYALLNVRDQLSRVEGVGSVNLFGARDYSMRIWLDTASMEALDLVVGDVVAAVQGQNLQVAAGSIGQEPQPTAGAFQLPIQAVGRLEDVDQFADVVVRSGPAGRLVRLGDVARLELGAQDYAVNSYLGEQPAVAMVVSPQPDANALATAQGVLDTLEELSADFPPGLEYRVIYNPTDFVAESVREVVVTLLQAIALVVLVVLVFLKTWRATLIPAAAIPVSLIGTFAAMLALGFSLNNLSLFGLVLAIGIVVDDAIVVVENVERKLAEGLTPAEATHATMDEVGSALVATSLVLVAVFVPTAAVSGITGQFYRQFALTIAVSTVISTFVSLTLSPALATLLLRREEDQTGLIDRVWNRSTGWFFRIFDWLLGKVTTAYVGLVRWIVRLSLLALLAYAASVGATGWGFTAWPTGFIPQQDQGYLIVSIQMPDGASLSRTDAVVKRVIAEALDTDGIAGTVAFAGFSGATRSNASNAGAVFTTLEPFAERGPEGLTAPKILGVLQGKLAQIREGQIVVIPPPPVRGIGTGGGFKLMVQDRSDAGPRRLQEATENLVGAARGSAELERVFSSFRAATPQLFVDLDRSRAEMLDVPVDGVFQTLQVYLGSLFINEFNLLGRTYRVTAQAEARYRDDPEDIGRLRTRSRTGASVPLGSVLDVSRVVSPDRVVRYNLYPAAEFNGQAAPGVSSGDALALVEKLAADKLPEGFSGEWTELAYQQKAAGNTALYIFPLCVLFAFLALAALYESWLLPLAVILIVPLCLSFGLAGIVIRDMPNDVMVQIGFIVLVGLACKNAILIVEFAKQLQDEGRGPVDAALEACRLRLRPILMTAFSFILGVVPLLIATGPGAEIRRALGTTVFAGMLGVTLVGLFLTPVFYVVLQRLAGHRAGKGDARRDGRDGAATPETDTDPASRPQDHDTAEDNSAENAEDGAERPQTPPETIAPREPSEPEPRKDS